MREPGGTKPPPAGSGQRRQRPCMRERVIGAAPGCACTPPPQALCDVTQNMAVLAGARQGTRRLEQEGGSGSGRRSRGEPSGRQQEAGRGDRRVAVQHTAQQRWNEGSRGGRVPPGYCFAPGRWLGGRRLASGMFALRAAITCARGGQAAGDARGRGQQGLWVGASNSPLCAHAPPCSPLPPPF